MGKRWTLDPANAPPIKPIAHQYEIREQRAVEEPRETIPSLDGCRVDKVDQAAAKELILKYEWLGTMGRSLASYGLYGPGNELLGVVLFGWPSSVESRDVCGKEYRDIAVCLERGACVHYAPDNAASFLISRAVKLAAAEHGWRIFYAYADMEAGEYGYVYQACNWLYIGQGVGRGGSWRLREDFYIPEEDKVISSRALRHRGITVTQAREMWESRWKHPKHKYVHFECNRTQRKVLLAALRYPVLPYPKRQP